MKHVGGSLEQRGVGCGASPRLGGCRGMSVQLG